MLNYFRGKRSVFFPSTTMVARTQGCQLSIVDISFLNTKSFLEWNQLAWLILIASNLKIFMVNTMKDRKMNKDTVSMEHTHRRWRTGLGAYCLRGGSPLTMAEQMLGRAEMSRVKVPSRSKTGKNAQPTSVSQFVLPQSTGPSSLCLPITHILWIVLLFVFEEIDLYICKENPRAFSS